MPDITTLLQSGAANPWTWLPLAVLLGALHALEPGHAKSVMAAFIIAVRGTVGQAVLLGLSAAAGHTIIVWGLAALGLWLGDRLILDRAEPWLTFVSGLLIMLLALRLFLVLRPHTAHDHEHAHAHGHDHDHHDHDRHHHDHGHDHDGHNHASPAEIARDYGGRKVGALEVVWFGFTGGLMPCPSALAVLLVCLQMRAYSLGFAMVGAFSLGLAITLVAIGVAAAWGARKIQGSWSGFDRFARIVPFVSAGVVMIMGLVMTLVGLSQTGVLA